MIINKIKKDFPQHEIVRITDSITDPSIIEQEIQAQDLFGNNRVIFLSDILEEFQSSVITGLQHIPTTTVIFWAEDSFPVALIKKIPPHTIWEESEKKIEKINSFTIANELPFADPKKLWITYQKLLANNIEPEPIFGMLWWKLKDVAKQKKTLSPEFKKTMHRFLEMYIISRQSNGDLETGLEQLLLSLNKKDLA